MTDHVSVLLQEAVDVLVHDPDGVYVDCTFGRGGHSREVLKCLSERGRLLVFDQDEEAIEQADALAQRDARVSVHHQNFTQMADVVRAQGLDGQIAGVLADLGVSSPQIDQAERGFSFRFEAPLDMRMDRRQSLDAAQVIAQSSETQLADIFYAYGEERRSRRVARAVVAAREEAAINTTTQLAKIVERALPRARDGRHPATKVFQALRIYVNGELDAVDQLLSQLSEVLRPGGVAAMISFHSLEDRRVKRFFATPRIDSAQRKIPVAGGAQRQKWQRVVQKIKASPAELERNPRASSAVLRAARWVA